MSVTASSLSTFAPVAQKVAFRVSLNRGLKWLIRTLWPVVALVAVLVIASTLTGSRALAWSSLIILALWLLLTLAWAFWKRPGHYSVLALWDQAAKRREDFATAWWFEQQATQTEAQSAHLSAQKQRLAEALPQLSRDLPLPLNRWLLLPFVLSLAGLTVTETLHPTAKPLTVDEAMAQIAQKEARELAQMDWDKKKLEGLQAEESAALEQLKQNLKRTSEALEKAGGQDAREVMSSLESRAREAEKLAERLAADKENWASEKLIQSLREHADTADLGDAVAAKNTRQTSKAAEAIAQQLQSPQLTQDTRDRLKETLKAAAQQSEAEDQKRTVGQHVLKAGDQLQKDLATDAGQEFQKLAEKMSDLARREQAQKELEKLAQQLRDAGSNISGQNQAGGMQEMAAAGQSPQSNASAPSAPQVGQSQPPSQGPSADSALQPPGAGQMSQAQQQMLQQNPVPGTGQEQQMQMGQLQPGQQGQEGKHGEGQPMLIAPIPGQKPGEKPDALVLGPPGDNPGNGPMMMLSAPGGKQPGFGKADLNAEATAKQNSSNQAVVAAQQNNEGQSSTRSVEGGARQENATRSASQIATEAIAAEEEALDEAALPPARRDQVRRYFTELRKRFESKPQ